MTVNQILMEIDRHRARIPMTVDELNKKAGLSRSTYIQWMNGTYKPSLQVLVQACDAMGLEVCIRRKGETE